MGKTLTWEFLGRDKTTPTLQKIARSFDETAKRAESFGKDGSRAIDSFTPAAARAKAAVEDMAADMSESVQRATDRIAKARQVEADQLGRLRVAETRLAEIRADGYAKASQVAAAEEAVAAAHRRVEVAQLSVAAAQRKLNDERAKAVAEAAKEADTDISGPKFDFSSGISRIKAQAISELKSAGITAGAAFAGGLGAGLSTVGAAGFFIAIAAAAQSSNEKVAESYAGLWNQVKNQVRDASDVLADDFIASAEKLGQTMNAIKPQLAAGFAAGQEPLNDLVDGADRLVRQALPGIVTGAQAAHLATKGLADGMDSAGKGVSNFFTESSQGAEAGGEAFRAFGQIVERLGSFAGRILADLANSSVQTWPAVTTAVDSAATAIENLATHALPGLASGAAMSLNTFSLLLNLANSVITVLGPAAPVILNVATALKLLDMVSFGTVQGQWDKFKTSIAEAPGIVGKTKAGFTGLLSTLGPIGVAAGIAAIGLDALSSQQQRAASRQAALNQAFRESKGAIDDTVRSTVAKIAADEDMFRKASMLGIQGKTLVDALLGEKQALDSVNGALNNVLVGHEGLSASEVMNSDTAKEHANAAYDLKNALANQSSEMGKAVSNAQQYANATGQGAQANAALKKSIEDLQNVLAGLADKNLAYRNSVDATEDAQRAAADALKEHGVKSEEYSDAVRGVESAMLGQANAARDMATTTSTASTEAEKAAEGQRAYAAEVVKMATAAGQSAPPALRQMISGLSNAELAALGASREIKATGETVIRLPDGKTMVIAANDQASHKAEQVQAQLAALKDKWITIGVNQVTVFRTIYENSAPGSQPFSQGRKAKGGWVHGPGTTTSDSVPMLLSNREFVVRASEAQKNGPILEAINKGEDLRGLVDGPPAAMTAMRTAVASTVAQSTAPSRVVLENHLSISGREIIDVVQKEIRTRGGDVQKVIGTG